MVIIIRLNQTNVCGVRKNVDKERAMKIAQRPKTTILWYHIILYRTSKQTHKPTQINGIDRDGLVLSTWFLPIQNQRPICLVKVVMFNNR